MTVLRWADSTPSLLPPQVKQEERMKRIEAGELEVEDPREARLREQKTARIEEAAARKLSKQATGALPLQPLAAAPGA